MLVVQVVVVKDEGPKTLIPTHLSNPSCCLDGLALLAGIRSALAVFAPRRGCASLWLRLSNSIRTTQISLYGFTLQTYNT